MRFIQHSDTSQLPCVLFVICMENEFYLGRVNINYNFPIMVVVEIYEVYVVRKRNFAPKISCLRIYLLTIFHLSWAEDINVFRYIQTIHNILLCFSQRYPNNTNIMKQIITTLVIENSVNSTFTRNCYKVGYKIQQFRS